MARQGFICAAFAVVLCSGLAQAGPTPTEIIRDGPYQQLSSRDWEPFFPDNPLIDGPEDVSKASGVIPSVGSGRVVWEDGRTGNTVIMGFDLTTPNTSPSWQKEFLVSVGNPSTDNWQEGNPFVGMAAPQRETLVHRTVYDAFEYGVPSADPGDIQAGIPNEPPPGPGFPAPNTWLIQTGAQQRSPIFVNKAPGHTVLSWIHYPGTQSPFPSYPDTEIYIADYDNPGPTAALLTDPTAPQFDPAPRDSLAGDGRFLVWQEGRVHSPITQEYSWDVVVHDLTAPLGAANPLYIDGPAGTHKNQIDPDVSGRIVVWTQEEDPSGTEATNLYFQDLESNNGPVAITTLGTAAKAAVSMVTDEDGDYFVVWQDYRHDLVKSFFTPGPLGNGVWDYNWDIWAQKIEVGQSGEYELLDPAFKITAASRLGRQTNPDIDGLDVVWQTQENQIVGEEHYIYVWGPVPEPCTVLLVMMGAPVLLARRRRKRIKR